MKVFVVSDLHNEFSKFIPSSTSQSADVIILAGDIWKGYKGIEWARTCWPLQRIIYIAGNHEFYGSERKEVLSALKSSADQMNVDFLENEETIIDGVRFIGCTLWTDFRLFGGEMLPKCIQEAKDFMNDFSMIHENGRKFSPDDALNLFNKSYSFLKEKLVHEKFAGTTVVVTHYLPSMLSIADKYKENLLSACFASNLEELFGYAEFWIHGHTHESFNYIMKDTNVICNPRGYSRYDKDTENINFDPNLMINILEKNVNSHKNINTQYLK